MKVIITGFMGCGKTMVARDLARRLNVEMIDLDEFITAREGRSPAQLIVKDGEDAFRAIESDALRELILNNAASVIALGGGAWIQEVNRGLIREYDLLTVWLDVPFEVCWARIEASREHRPLARTREQAQALYNLRRPVYELADIHIKTVEELIDRITGFTGLNPANPETS